MWNIEGGLTGSSHCTEPVYVAGVHKDISVRGPPEAIDQAAAPGSKNMTTHYEVDIGVPPNSINVECSVENIINFVVFDVYGEQVGIFSITAHHP